MAVRRAAERPRGRDTAATRVVETGGVAAPGGGKAVRAASGARRGPLGTEGRVHGRPGAGGCPPFPRRVELPAPIFERMKGGRACAS